MTQNLDRFKFKVWDNEKNIMEYCDSGMHENTMSMWLHKIQNELYDAILLQSTGLKDKNGNLIYEGDVLDHFELIVCIKYDLDNGGFYIKGNAYGWNPLTHFRAGQCETIGNIHENPELLENI